MASPDPVEALLDAYDFRALRGALRGSGVRWRDASGRAFHPTQAHLRARARALLERLRASPDAACLRGDGFAARRGGYHWSLTYELRVSVYEEQDHAE